MSPTRLSAVKRASSLLLLLGLVPLTVLYAAWIVPRAAATHPDGSFIGTEFFIVVGGMAILMALYPVARSRHYKWAAAFLVLNAALLTFVALPLAAHSAFDPVWLLVSLLMCSLFFSHRFVVLLLIGIGWWLAPVVTSPAGTTATVRLCVWQSMSPRRRCTPLACLACYGPRSNTAVCRRRGSRSRSLRQRSSLMLRKPSTRSTRCAPSA